MPLHVGAPPKRDRERTKTSQFVIDERTIGSQLISMGACPDASAPGSPSEASS